MPSEAAVPGTSATKRATVFAIGTWLVPGLGYFFLKRWVRGALVLVCVAGMFSLGLAMQGKLYEFNTGDILDILGWVGDFCTGGLYFLSRAMNWGVGNQFIVMGDYGTKFLIAAGLLNVLAAADVRDVALGLKR
jgi:hypothetical protein